MGVAITAVADEPRSPQRFGQMRVAFKTITFDDDYTPGGEPVSAAALGLKKVLFAQLCDVEPVDPTYIFKYDLANEAIMAFECGADTDPLDEISTVTALEDVAVRIMAYGY